jgi:segregation and condensation protein B
LHKVDDTHLKAIIEALIFSSENPLALDRIREILGEVPKKEVQRLISEMVEEYRQGPKGFIIAEVAGGFQFRTRTELAEWVRKLKKTRPPGFSPAAMETLAIIAYRQPIIRLEVEKIRGVDCGGVLRTLLERTLVKIIGKKDVPGRPLVYGTTQKFLEAFGLKDLSSLPTLKDIEALGGVSLEGAFSPAGEEEGKADPVSGGPPSAEELNSHESTTQSSTEVTEDPFNGGHCLPTKS